MVAFILFQSALRRLPLGEPLSSGVGIWRIVAGFGINRAPAHPHSQPELATKTGHDRFRVFRSISARTPAIPSESAETTKRNVVPARSRPLSQRFHAVSTIGVQPEQAQKGIKPVRYATSFRGSRPHAATVGLHRVYSSHLYLCAPTEVTVAASRARFRRKPLRLGRSGRTEEKTIRKRSPAGGLHEESPRNTGNSLVPCGLIAPKPSVLVAGCVPVYPTGAAAHPGDW